MDGQETVIIATIQQTDAERFAQQWRKWHTQHEERIGDRHGFLAVTSINWLGQTPQRFEDAPGEWSTDATGVHVTLAGRQPALRVYRPGDLPAAAGREQAAGGGRGRRADPV